MKADLKDQKGKALKKIDLDDSVFKVDVNNSVIAQYIYSYLSNQRESNSHTKDRSEVSGGGKKPWRQKGTGRARFGSSRNPIWTGGGVAFGPTNSRNWKKVITKKFKKAAYRNILSRLFENKAIELVDDIDINGEDKLTDKATKLMKALNPEGTRLTVITEQKKDNVIKSFANLPKSRVLTITDVSPYDLYSGGKVVIEQKAIEYLQEKLKK